MADLEELKEVARNTYNVFVRRGLAAGRRPNDHWEPSAFRTAMRLRLQPFAVANEANFQRIGDRRVPLYNRLDMMGYNVDEVNDVNRFMETNNYPVELKKSVFQLIIQSLRDTGIAPVVENKAGIVAAAKLKGLSKQGIPNVPEEVESSIVGLLTGREESASAATARGAELLGRPKPAPAAPAAPPGGVGPAAAGAGGPAGGRRRKTTAVSGRRTKTRKVRSGRSRSRGSRKSQRRNRG